MPFIAPGSELTGANYASSAWGGGDLLLDCDADEGGTGTDGLELRLRTEKEDHDNHALAEEISVSIEGYPFFLSIGLSCEHLTNL